MTKKTILDNCKRLSAFYKEDEIIKISLPDNPTALHLFINYCNILDIMAADKKGLSLIFLPDREEFEEAKDYCKLNFKETFDYYPSHEDKTIGYITMSAYHRQFRFEYNEYFWLVINK